VLHDLSLSVSAGERLALVGPNGAGKSTLFNLISGRLRPSAGSVLLHGRAIEGLPPHAIHRLGVARSFQITQVFARLSAADNLRCASLAALGYGLNPFRRLTRLRALNDRVEQMLERAGLQSRREVAAGELSYAEQRRLELAMALAGDPSVLLLDEPTAGMNRSEAAQAVALIRELTEGRTLLLVEHDMGVVFDLADRIAVLDQGELLACDRPERIREDTRVQRAYLGAAAC
jgi:branched-chain amino acid transport system ATP-binding protein